MMPTPITPMAADGLDQKGVPKVLLVAASTIPMLDMTMVVHGSDPVWDLHMTPMLDMTMVAYGSDPVWDLHLMPTPITPMAAYGLDRQRTSLYSLSKAMSVTPSLATMVMMAAGLLRRCFWFLAEEMHRRNQDQAM